VGQIPHTVPDRRRARAACRSAGRRPLASERHSRPGAKGDAAGSRRKEWLNILFRAGNLPASPRVL